MQIALPNIELIAGNFYCVHLSPKLSDATDVISQITQLAERSHKSVIHAKPAVQRGGMIEFFRKQSAVAWLANAAGLSKIEAAGVIQSFPRKVAKTLSHNAGTPRAFLGVAAAIAQKPDVIVYSTAGVDPVGCQQLHEYVAMQARNLCIVHVSHYTSDGMGLPLPRIDPDFTRCIPLELEK